MADLFTLGLGLETTQLKQGTKELDTLTRTAATAEKNLKGVSTASTQAGKSFNSLRGQAANISYQMQDIAVQAQMGTSAFIIMAQQIPQLTSGFGPVGAAVGVVVALTAAIAGAAYQAMNGGDAAKSYSDEIELLSQTVSVSERGLVSFSDQFGRLAAERPEVAISRLRGELERVSSIMNIVASDTSMLLSDFGASAYTIQSANAQLKDFTGTQEELAEIIGQETLLGFTDSANAAMIGVGRLQEQVISLSEGFGISQADALQLTQALANIDTPQGIIDASKSVSEMAMRLQGASPEIDRLNVKLNEQRVRAENLLYSQQTLNKAIGDTQDVANNTETALDAVSKANLSAAQAALALQDRIDVQRTSMEEGEAAAIRLAAELSLGGNVSDELKEKVGNLAVEYYNLTEAEKAAQEQQRELAREQAEAARAQDRINKQAQQEVERAIRDGMTREDQIRAEAEATIALINASTELSDVQKELAGIQVQENAQKEIKEAAEKGLKNVPSDFAMSVSEALASQDYSSFGNILASQAASSIGTAVTDSLTASMGATMGGALGGLAGGVAGAVISQAISNYLADDLIALDRQASQGTGTVLGSIDEKSASIANSMDYMTDALDDLIGVNTSGFRSMQALVNSLSGASNLVARDFNAEGIAGGLGLSGLGGITQDFGGIVDDLFGGLTGGLFEGIFGGIGGALFGRSKVSDEGIRLLGGTIAEMIDNDVAQAYQTVTKKSLFGSSRSDNFRFAGDAIEQQFDLTLAAMRDAVVSSAEQLNMLPSEIQDNLDAFTVEATRISIKDLSASEVADELNAVFSSILDGMASAVVPFVDDFQRSGEGAGETLSRLSTNLSVVDEMLSQLRLSDLQGTTQQMLMLSEGIVDFFGDASGLATAFTGFVSDFATQERQLEILTDGLTRALGEQDVAILKSRDGVYDYIASLERLDDGNADRIANILSLSGSLDDYFNLLEAVNEELISSALDPAMVSLNRAIDSERDQLRDSYETQREAAQNLLETLNEGFGDLEKVADSLENAISSTVSMSAEAARAQLQSARNQIAAFADSGIIPDSNELNKLLSIVTGDNAKYYATAADYYREQGRTANDIAFLSEIADEQLSEAEQQIKAQEGILEQLEKQYQLDLDYLDSLLEAYQNEYDALMGIDVSILSVADAVARVEAAINNLKLISGGSGGSGGSGVSSSEISSAYDYLQQQNTSSGMTDWDATDYQTGLAAINAGISSQELADSLGVSASYVQQRAEELGLPAFANGGTFSQGGLALVGERGPEIVNMPAGTHVSTAQQTGSLMDNSQLVGLVQELIDKTIVQNGYAKKSYDILNQVSTGGKSFNTDSVIVKTL